MPRKAAADLHVIRLPGQGRPEPPATLTQAEQSAWRAIVDSAPGGWLDPTAQLVLQRVVAQIGIAARHEERLRRIAEAGGDLDAEIEISRAHRETSKAIITGLHALRATPASRMPARKARDAYTRSPSGRLRPWEIEAKATEAGKTESGEPDEADHGEAPA
jgi:hypothetical protein